MSMEKCRKCRHVDSWEKCEECYEWCNFEGNTNGNKIRSMSDEELAEFLESFEVCHVCKYHNLEDCLIMQDKLCTDGYARERALEWLKSEAKE